MNSLINWLITPPQFTVVRVNLIKTSKELLIKEVQSVLSKVSSYDYIQTTGHSITNITVFTNFDILIK